MQRFYRVLLRSSIILGALVMLRPCVAQEYATNSPYARQAPVGSSSPYASYPPAATPAYASRPYAQPWASSPVQPDYTAGNPGEAEVSDEPYSPNHAGMSVPSGHSPATPGPPPETASHAPPSPAASKAVPCEGAQIVARVGPKVILASEVTAAINEILAQYKDKIPPSQLEIQRKLLMQKLLEQRIDIKLVYYDAERKIPKENVEKIKERLGEQFETVEVPRRIKDGKLDSRYALEEKMLALGTSLEREKRAFTERIVAMQWVQQQATANDEISHEQMLAFYQDHLADFEHSARARWEQLMVRKSSHPSEAEARAALARMGNEVLQGTSFAEVAKKHSEGPTASRGGVWDWTTKGSLVSESLDQAIFGLPVGQLSQIIRDDQGYHIVRVIQREDASRTPFVEAQVEIRKKIREQREKEAREKYLAKLREEIPIWTVFDSEIAQKPKSSAPFAPPLQR